MTLALAVDLLKRCLVEQDPVVREVLIHEFHDLVNDAADVQDEHVLDVLATAQDDLAYYEPREEWRVDRSLYDDRELNRRLVFLRGLGQDDPSFAEAIDGDEDPSVWQRLLERLGRRGGRAVE